MTIGDPVAVAAGSTITGDVPDGALAVERGKERQVDGWMARRSKAAKPAQQSEPQAEASTNPSPAADEPER